MLFITLATIILQILNISFIENSLAYHRNLFWEQIPWQWISPSLIHLNWNHWLLNILNLYAAIILFSQVWSSKKLIYFFSLASLFILLSLHYFSTDIKEYAGMSGVLYAIITYGAVKSYTHQKIISLLLIGFIILKLFFDEKVNSFLGINNMLEDIYIVTDVHWYGVGFALLFLLFERIVLKYYNLTYFK